MTCNRGDTVEKNGVEAGLKRVFFNHVRYVQIDYEHYEYGKTENVELIRYGKGLQFK
ncbi:MAG: hypothetical protein BTN85_0561 [Candidatus Methanohalarchaeum thermophilum]|uniref:Uncharacterized protein n=1 Tax=Methanohalarchaeum thermophilum TaxID=1903181 RepID=A0A1Q6DUP3_METT1|nr:MAG: hypothetical protein BTN85_0561 [Candidatus Methanohalarchaeum thermophilum]